MDNALHRRQTYTGTFESPGLVKTLKYTKQLVRILHIKTNPVVPHKHYHGSVLLQRAYFDLRTRARTGKFDGVGDQVYQYQPQHGAVAERLWQGPDVPGNFSAIRLP